MSNLVVFQWGRLGDLVQTGIVLNRWRAQIGGTIAIVYDRRYRDVVDELTRVDRGISVDIQHLVESACGNVDASHSLASISETMSKTSSLRGGVHLVLSRSPSAALMSHLLEPDHSLGYTWANGKLQVPALLEEYLNETGSEPYPVHICDAWSMLAKLECTPPGIAGRSAYENRSNSQTRLNNILIFADAGEPYRTPPVKWLADLGRDLISGGKYTVTYVGSRSSLGDDPITQLSAAHRERVLDMRGHTSLKSLIELCRKHAVVIGSDTGGLHLAAACGCRPIGLYFGGASVHNTGPFSEGAVVLQNPEWTREELDKVVRLIDQAKASRSQNESLLSEPRIWRSAWDAGGMTYLNDGRNMLQADAIRNARQVFVVKWSMPSRRLHPALAT